MISVEVAEGKLQYNRAWMDKVIQGLPDGLYVLDFIPVTTKRSQAQNAYYWGVVLDTFAKEVADGSYTKQEWHDLLGAKFRSTQYHLDGEDVTALRETKGMSTEEFSMYLETCIRYAAEQFGVQIPDARRYGL